MRTQLAILAVAWVFATTGCGPGGPPRHLVSGVVTLEGKPLVDAEVRFETDDREIAPEAARTDSSGGYSIPLRVARYTVRVFAPTPGPVPPKLKATVGKHFSTVMNERVPPRYNRDSILTVNVNGPTRFGLDLTAD